MGDVRIFILQTGIGKARTAIFQKQLTDRLNATLCNNLLVGVTHIVVDDTLDPENIDKLLNLNAIPESRRNYKIVKSKWVSHCIDKNEFIDSREFEIALPFQENLANKHLNRNGTSVDNNEQNEKDQNALKEPEKKMSKWVCMKSSKSDETNFNKSVTDELEKLMKTYENMNERWRALSYRKAIKALKDHPSPITSYEEAIRLPGIGTQLAEKICEIVESGKLRKLSELKEQDSIKSLEVFTNIWGAGPQTAKLWVANGFRTLQDLKDEANLTSHQEIGLKYYDELLEKMNREEVEEIGNYVRNMAVEKTPGCEVIICGSFRRGRQFCGDTDLLISHRDGTSHAGLFDVLIEGLKNSGFVTDELVTSNSGNQQKFLGICKLLKNGSMHRRIDVIVVPYDEFFPALVYFTGSGHFNRSMRNFASKMGMSLNEHGLFKDVIRKRGTKMNSGIRLSTPDEESIFKHLNIPFRPPEERDF